MFHEHPVPDRETFCETDRQTDSLSASLAWLVMRLNAPLGREVGLESKSQLELEMELELELEMESPKCSTNFICARKAAVAVATNVAYA